VCACVCLRVLVGVLECVCLCVLVGVLECVCMWVLVCVLPNSVIVQFTHESLFFIIQELIQKFYNFTLIVIQ